VGRVDSAVAVDLVDALAKLDDSISADLESRTYATSEEFLDTVWAAVDGVSSRNAAARDAVM
jgi:hypothetical protein